jgi:integrase
MSRSPRVPGYRQHSSGQARVTLDGKDFLLGPYGSEESKEAYRRTIAEWAERKGQFAPKADAPPLSVNELLLAYYKHATVYYGWDNDPDRGDAACLRDALRVVKDLYGSTPAKDFGPLALKACRRQMIEKSWSRTYINAQTDRVRRVFRWGVEEELVPSSVYEGLRAVAGLRRGKSGEVRETKKVKPVDTAHVEAAWPHMAPPVAGMVRLQQLTGCRPAEACLVRLADIDRGNPGCWVYRPACHKTEHHGHARLIFIGPRAQQIILDFVRIRCPLCGVEGRPPRIGCRDGALCGPCADRMDDAGVCGPWPRVEVQPADGYLFSPMEAEAERSEKRRQARKSPMTPSQAARKAKAGRRREPGELYDTYSYRRAIAYACRKADRAAHEKDASIPADVVLVPEWSPNRLRHNRATELRPYGLDMAKTVLGHARVESTQVYAEKDIAAAMELVARIG